MDGCSIGGCGKCKARVLSGQVHRVRHSDYVLTAAEKSASIAYAGSWRSATHAGYAGDAVRYATAAGATATFTFTGTKVVWYGPVGPTRGQARILIDGTAVKTVDLRAGSFTAHRAIFSKSWAASGKHTLVIEVAGTAGRPYVAIDELAVAK
jgi:hypothetical protein